MKKRKFGYSDRGRRVGETHYSAKLSDHEVNLIREMYEEGDITIYRLAKIFEIAKSHCWDIVHYRKRISTVENWYERKNTRRSRAPKTDKKK